MYEMVKKNKSFYFSCKTHKEIKKKIKKNWGFSRNNNFWN